MVTGDFDLAICGQLIARAATIDELLSDDFETLPGQKDDADVAANRLAAWCKSCASGDWSLFNRRLQRDGFALDRVLARFATAGRRLSAPPPTWTRDAIWIQTALHSRREAIAADDKPPKPGRNAFEQLFTPLTHEAAARLWASVGTSGSARLTSSAWDCLRQRLLEDLCGLCAPVLYDRFTAARGANAVEHQRCGATTHYDQFVLDMKSGGLRRLFDERPVLLRLITSLTRQWLIASREFVTRLDADVEAVRREILHTSGESRIARIEGGLSDPHRGGRMVLCVEFEDGPRVMYKPKDLRVDVAWHSLVARLNTQAPITLRTVRTVARDGYGWTEFIDHAGCVDAQAGRRFFRRAGAWLALFHCFAASDIHHENLIAAGDHPVPIDLETILQAAVAPRGTLGADAGAVDTARDIVANSVMAVGLLPAYGRSADNHLYSVGGVAADWTAETKLAWRDINSDTMRPLMIENAGKRFANLPHHAGDYAKLGDHLDDFISGFQEYATFLLSHTRDGEQGGLFDGFAGLPVRRVIRPTQFYSMLLHRLRNDRTMDDGALWSAQADFLARLADWDADRDPMWPLQLAERSALVELNVPLFVMASNGSEISDTAGITVETAATSGLQRARDRVRHLDEREIAWQTDIIRQTSSFVSNAAKTTALDRELKPLAATGTVVAATPDIFLAEADTIAEEIARHAIRRGSSAAWIGHGWLPDSDVCQPAVLGPDLYNGACGIALFLSAHAMATQQPSSTELALAAVSHLRADLRSNNAAHLARLLGLGGATGLGSVSYALAVMSRLLTDDDLLEDAHLAAALISDDLIAADKQLDVIAGSAGAILCLLRLYQDTQEQDTLDRAVKCGAHLLAQQRVGPPGRRTWRGPAPDARALNGMSHGAAGFAYALSSLAAVTGRERFAVAATECIEFERSGYDAERCDWKDFRVREPHWRSQWCHGAVGIGLARLGMTKRGTPGADALAADIRNALAGADRGWPGHVDTLCCGAAGSVELASEAGKILERSDLCELSSRRLLAVLQNKASTGDFRWSGGARRFNVGLFRGLAGVGYTCLRQVDPSVPNVLIWE
jgi:type 2 lantibiotic biosynthesis protein LanM